MKKRVIVTADPARNLLQISFVGHIGLDEVEYYEKTIEDALPTMSPEFHLLTDFTGLESMDVVCVPYIERTMDRIRRRGVARIVRVIPDPHKDIGYNIMSLFHYPRGLLIVTCENKTEAEQALK